MPVALLASKYLSLSEISLKTVYSILMIGLGFYLLKESTIVDNFNENNNKVDNNTTITSKNTKITTKRPIEVLSYAKFKGKNNLLTSTTIPDKAITVPVPTSISTTPTTIAFPNTATSAANTAITTITDSNGINYTYSRPEISLSSVALTSLGGMLCGLLGVGIGENRFFMFVLFCF